MDVQLSKNLGIEDLRLLGEAIDSSPSPLTLYDKNYNIIYANETSRKLWPELHEELSKGVGLEKAAYQAAITLFPDAPEEVIRGATDYVIYTFNSPDANEMKASDDRWMKLTHHQIGDRAIAGIGVDITDLKRKEKSLERARRAQGNLIEVLEYGLLVIDDAGLITLFNPAYQDYCKSVGFEIHVGMHAKELTANFIKTESVDIGNVDFDVWFDEFYRTRFGSNESFEEEFSLSDGRHILRHQNYRKLVGNIITITDITEIKNAQLKAESAERSKSEFLANMSHEIRTPMNGVMGMAQLLERCDLDEKEHGFVKIIQRSSEALLTIINDILDFSKIEAGRVVLDNAQFNLRNSLRDVIALLSMAAAEKNVELLLQIQPGLPENFVGDVGRVRQIITNIFGNAVKFTHEGHVLIDVKGERVEKSVNLVISIEDTGIGIESSQIDDVFNKFQQADGSTTRKFEGTGLGLSIAKQLVNLMGGEVTARSEIGKGSCFEIQLSLPIAHEEKALPTDEITFKGSKVLIIDDNPINCQILKENFTYWNCKTAAVNSVKRGIQTLELAAKKNFKFDLIILDYQMPGETGEVFVEKVKAHSEFKNIPIIMLTSVVETSMAQRLLNKGLEAYQTKPFNNKLLFETITTLLNKAPKTEHIATSKADDNIVPLNLVPPNNPDKDNQSESISAPSSPTKIDILVAEDNEVNRLYIDYVLKELGVSFQIVNDGQMAVDSFEILTPRLILMDISMPVLNGYQATNKIRDIERLNGAHQTPIIAITAHALEGDKERCLKAGMDGYLAKPLAMSSVKKILAQWNIIEAPMIECREDVGKLAQTGTSHI